MRENYSNFATTNLVTPSSMSAGATSFTVTGGQGAIFPTASFVVTMDTEIMFITSRSSDTFTIGQRGYDGTSATTHVAGAQIQLTICNYTLTHLWENVPDTYVPEVPPQHRGLTPASYDQEFESTGSWTLYPSAGSGTTWTINTTMASHLVLGRGNSDNAMYVAYQPFTPSGAFTLTARVSMGASYYQTQQYDQPQLALFVSDQTNPTSSSHGGSQFQVHVVDQVQPLSGNNLYNTRFVRNAYCSGGSQTLIAPSVFCSPGMTLWLRIDTDGAGAWHGSFGDGFTYWLIQHKTSFSFSPQSMGFYFTVYNPSSSWVPQVATVDYVRYATGQLPSWGV